MPAKSRMQGLEPFPGLLAPVSSVSSLAGTRVASSFTKERLLVGLVIAFTSISFFVIEYNIMRPYGPGLAAAIQAMLAGNYPAPEQYRIGFPLLAHFLELHAHLKLTQAFPLLEFLAFPPALGLLYAIFSSAASVRSASPSRRATLVGFFLVALQLPVLWIAPWGRPETLPAALYLAAIVALTVCPTRIPTVLACLLATVLSFSQGLMRADIAVVAGVAIMLAAGLSLSFPRPRSHIAAIGTFCTLTGAATQFYLQRIAYPNATYPPITPKFQLFMNFVTGEALYRLPSFLIALLPFAFSLYLVRQRSLPLDDSDKLVLLLCLIYLPVWTVMGNIAEVRIFVPFLFLAAPTIAKVWAGFLLGAPPPASPLSQSTIDHSQPALR